jgi:hypothetical protein
MIRMKLLLSLLAIFACSIDAARWERMDRPSKHKRADGLPNLFEEAKQMIDQMSAQVSAPTRMLDLIAREQHKATVIERAIRSKKSKQ